jgi:hypothetical protein
MFRADVMLAIFSVAVLAACAGQPPAQSAEQVEVTRVVEVTREVVREVEVPVEVTRVVQVTRLVEPTAAPTAEPATEDHTPLGGSKFALNYLGTYESGGLEVEVIRILFGHKDELPQSFDWDEVKEFEAVDVLGMLILRLTNTTEVTMKVYPDQGSMVLVGSDTTEQVEFLDYWVGALGGLDDLGGDIFSGVTKIGGFYFGVRQLDTAEIISARLIFDAPTNSDYDDLGADFDIALDLSVHEFQPYPEELD